MASPETVQKEIFAALQDADIDCFRRILLEDKERLSITTPFGTWLQTAAVSGQLGIMKVLVEEIGVDINERAGRLYEGGPLYIASTEGHADVVRYLLDTKATLDVEEPLRNPLFGAIFAGRADIAQMLLDAGIDPDVRYDGDAMENMDALAFARERGQKDIEMLLVADQLRRGVPDNHATGRKKPNSALPHVQIVEHMAQHFGAVKPLALHEILPSISVPVAIHVIPETPTMAWCSSRSG